VSSATHDWRNDIEAASRRIHERAPHFLRETPLWKLPAEALGLQVRGLEVWLKLEHLQVSGSFKARGMMNRLLANDIPAAGAIVASGGNAGIATAAAAQALGVHCAVFLPEVSTEAKRARLRALGAEVVVGGEAYADALAACLERQRETGALVSVGGGGLIGGLAAWFEQRSRVVALEPERAPTLFRAREAGEPVDVEVGGVAADSLGARRIGAIAWDVTQRHVRNALLLPDEAIRAAQIWLWKELKLAVEPAAALPLAALRSGAYVPREGEKVCLIVCGANVDPATLN
jgi:threonine dehydratase